jgi:hypothetical protein
MHAIIRNDQPETLSGAFIGNDGTQHPANVLSLWSTAELAAIDVYPVTDEPVPDGHVVTGSSLHWDGETVTRVFVTEPAPPPSVEDHRRAVQDHIDATAQSRGYNDGVAMAGYVNSSVPPWRAEAETFVAWRDSVWLYVFELLAQIEAGDSDPPASTDALIGWLPQIEWP